MLGLLPSVAKVRNTLPLKLNVPTLDVIASGVPTLSLNDRRTLVIAARAEVRASNEVTTRVRIVFFIWLFSGIYLVSKSLWFAVKHERCCLQIGVLVSAGCQSRRNN